MHKTTSFVLSRRQLLPLLALIALLATLLLAQPPSVRGVKASVKTVVTTPCTIVDLGVAASQPQAPGPTFLVQSLVTGCTAEYRYLFLAPGSTTWVFKTVYSTNTGYQWNTAGLQQGVWQIGVWVRPVGSTAKYQTWSLGTFALVTSYCTSATITPAVTLTTTADITLTPASTGCIVPLYQWLELVPGSTTWVTAHPYGPSSSDPTLHLILDNPKGAYRFVLEAKFRDSTRRYDTYAELTFWWLG
jgi:hypothetical protein